MISVRTVPAAVMVPRTALTRMLLVTESGRTELHQSPTSSGVVPENYSETPSSSKQNKWCFGGESLRAPLQVPQPAKHQDL